MGRTVGRRTPDSGSAVSSRASVPSVATGRLPRRRRTRVSALTLLIGGCLSACGTGLTPAASGSATVAGPIPSGLESFYHQTVDWYPCGATGGMETASEETSTSAATTAAAGTTSEATEAPSSGSASGTDGTSEGTDDATFSCDVVSFKLY